ncbi:probable histone-lysine N-methyltransferase set-23 [Saccostrea cucullata]|uniref:probable histone-lysine N-methyltransferase set-23 n=1 Tax=Saccostrea cuccullata TaxID=36930 RepID=UPI002ED3020F
MDETIDDIQSDWTNGLEKYPIYCRDNGKYITRDTKFQYVKHNIPGPGTQWEKFESLFEGCSCKECLSDCPCIQRFGRNYSEDGKLYSKYLHGEEQKVIVECNSNCTCSKNCVNKNVQHGVQIRLELFCTANKGAGVKTLEDVSPGMFVCEYAGEILTYEEAKNRSLAQQKRDMNYIITVNEHCKSGVIKTHVDPRYFGNVGRFLNHSCDPNLTMIPIRVNNEIPLLCLFANRKINTGEELTFHYGLSSEINVKNNTQLEVEDSNLIPCLCNAQGCSGYLPFDKTLFNDH